MTTTIKLTDAARRGLLTIHRAEEAGAFARESNTTDSERHLVYWQTLRTLLGQGLITVSLGGRIALTDAGRQLAREVTAR